VDRAAKKMANVKWQRPLPHLKNGGSFPRCLYKSLPRSPLGPFARKGHIKGTCDEKMSTKGCNRASLTVNNPATIMLKQQCFPFENGSRLKLKV